MMGQQTQKTDFKKNLVSGYCDKKEHRFKNKFSELFLVLFKTCLKGLYCHPVDLNRHLHLIPPLLCHSQDSDDCFKERAEHNEGSQESLQD